MLDSRMTASILQNCSKNQIQEVGIDRGVKANPNLDVSPSRLPLSTSSPAQQEPAVCGRSLLLCFQFSSPGTTSVPAAPRCRQSQVSVYTHTHKDTRTRTDRHPRPGRGRVPDSPRPNPRQRRTSKRGRRKGAIRSPGRDPEHPGVLPPRPSALGAEVPPFPIRSPVGALSRMRRS